MAPPDTGDTAMTLADIFDAYTAGSTGLCIAVESHCGFQIGRPEIARIAMRAAIAGPNSADMADEFDRLWSDDAWWSDDNA